MSEREVNLSLSQQVLASYDDTSALSGSCPGHTMRLQDGRNPLHYTVLKYPLYATLQCDQPSPRPEAGGGDFNVIAQAHWQHRGHLLCLLHYLRNPGSPGRRRERGEAGVVLHEIMTEQPLK